MALTYSLEMATEASPRRVLESFFSGLGRQVDVQRVEGKPGVLTADGPGFWAWASYVDDDVSRMSAERFGITPPNVSLSFKLDLSDDHTAAGLRVLAGVVEVLKRVPGDAVFLFNGEIVKIKRLAGRVVVNENPECWSTSGQDLALITIPYEKRPIPVA